MRLYSGSGRRLSGKKGGKRLAGGGKRLRSKGLGLAPVAGMLAIACCLGGLLWCVRAGFPNRTGPQAPGGSHPLFFPPPPSGARRGGRGRGWCAVSVGWGRTGVCAEGAFPVPPGAAAAILFRLSVLSASPVGAGAEGRGNFSRDGSGSRGTGSPGGLVCAQLCRRLHTGRRA